MAQIKGRAIRVRMDYLTEHFGEDGWRSVCEALAPEHGKMVERGILVSGWYPLALNSDILGCAERLLGDGDGALCRAMGSSSARRGLQGVHSAFSGRALPATEIANKMSRSTALLWQVHYDTGTMETRATGPHAIESCLWELDVESPWICEVLTGYIGTHIEVLGGRNVHVEHVCCQARGDADCKWHSHWS